MTGTLQHKQRIRRLNENVEFSELAKLLPMPASVTEQLDKASIVRLTASYLKLRQLYPRGLGIEWGSGCHSSEQSIVKELGSQLLQCLDGFVFVLSADGKIIYTSETVSVHLGLSQADLIGNSIYNLIHDSDCAEVELLLKYQERIYNDDLVNEDEEKEVSFCLRMRCVLSKRNAGLTIDGLKAIHCNGYLKLGAKCGCSQDATTQIAGLHRHAIGLVAIGYSWPTSAATVIRMFDCSFMFRSTLQLSILHTDPCVFQLTGYEPRYLMYKKLYQFVHAADCLQLRKDHISVLAKGQVITKYYRFLTRGGGWIWMQSYCTINKSTTRTCIIALNQVISGREYEEMVMSEEAMADEIYDSHDQPTITCKNFSISHWCSSYHETEISPELTNVVYFKQNVHNVTDKTDLLKQRPKCTTYDHKSSEVANHDNFICNYRKTDEIQIQQMFGSGNQLPLLKQLPSCKKSNANPIHSNLFAWLSSEKDQRKYGKTKRSSTEILTSSKKSLNGVQPPKPPENCVHNINENSTHFANECKKSQTRNKLIAYPPYQLFYDNEKDLTLNNYSKHTVPYSWSSYLNLNSTAPSKKCGILCPNDEYNTLLPHDVNSILPLLRHSPWESERMTSINTFTSLSSSATYLKHIATETDVLPSLHKHYYKASTHTSDVPSGVLFDQETVGESLSPDKIKSSVTMLSEVTEVHSPTVTEIDYCQKEAEIFHPKPFLNDSELDLKCQYFDEKNFQVFSDPSYTLNENMNATETLLVSYNHQNSDIVNETDESDELQSDSSFSIPLKESGLLDSLLECNSHDECFESSDISFINGTTGINFEDDAFTSFSDLTYDCDIITSVHSPKHKAFIVNSEPCETNTASGENDHSRANCFVDINQSSLEFAIGNVCPEKENVNDLMDRNFNILSNLLPDNSAYDSTEPKNCFKSNAEKSTYPVPSKTSENQNLSNVLLESLQNAVKCDIAAIDKDDL